MNRSVLLRLLLLCTLLSANPAWADGESGDRPAQAGGAQDVLTLKDGRRLEGEIVGEDDRFVSLRSGGVTRSYAKDSVASVERAPRAPGSAAPGAGPAEPAPPAGDPAGKQKKRERPDRKDAPLSDAAKAWLDALLARTAESDESVRRSIGAAIGALGPAAIPAVRAAEAAATDGPQKQFLARLAADMEGRRDRRGTEPGARPADGGAGAPRRPLEDVMRRLTTELELRDEQKPKVEAIVKDALQKRFELFRDARRDGLVPEEVATKAEALRIALLAEMKSALDEPQYAMFEEMSKRLFEAPRGPMPPKPPAPEGQPTPPAPDQPK